MPESVFQEGTIIAGRYRLDEPLGEGGMGEVWAATHTVTRRTVALKFLKESLRNKAGLRQRFLREASTASALRHPHVVEILDVFDFEERAPVLVMELLQGETLGAKLARDGRLSLEETAALVLPVTSAVGTAHALGIVHRDLKPENIFLARLDDELRVKVLDFGIAKLTAEHYLEGGRSALVTDTGAMLGTPCYMAPEQATGEPADHRADIWSIGVILYECLSGTRPIEGENMPQVVARLVSAGIIPLERLTPEHPQEVTALVTQILTRDPTRRPQNLAEVSKVLGRYTMVRAPGFGPPSLDPGSAPPVAVTSSPPRAKIVANRDVDPQGRTMLSSPAVGGSIATETPPLRPRWRRVTAASLGFVVVLLLLSILVISALGNRPDGEAASAATSMSPVPVQTPTTAPTEPVAPVPVQTVVENQPEAPGSVKASTAKRPAPKPVTARKTSARPTTPVPATKPQSDEGTLFPGRK